MTPRKINRYEIKQELGRGGMATVYEAYDPQFQRPVAVKMLPREFLHDPEFRARFTREARTIAALEHPAIVPVYDFGEEDAQPFLVMRLMTGGSLTDRLEQGPLSIEQASEILKRIGSALDRAHTLGIIHRDLKPSNILFDQYNDAFLADFGIARLASASSQLTASGSLVGTPTYMSPEQVYGNKEIDGRADIYALGVILYQMLTGEIPYEADTPARMMMAHVMNPVPHLIDKRPDLAACDLVVTKAMAKERDERFSTASDMTNALTEITRKMKQPDFAPEAAASPPTIEHAAPAPVEKPTDTAVPAPPAPSSVKAPSSFEEPTYGEDLITSITGEGTKIPAWLWIVGGLLILFCLAGSLGLGYLVVDSLSNGQETETPTAVAGMTEESNGSVFGSLTSTATATTTPLASPTAPPTGTAVAPEENPALATRQSLEATRAAAAGSQNDDNNNNNTGAFDALATRQSLAATRAAETGPESPVLFGALDEFPALYSVDEGELPHDPDDDTIELFYPGVNQADFVLNVTVINPFTPETGNWDFGVIFRQTEPDDEMRLVIRSDGLWNLNNRQEEGDSFVQEGDVTDILDLRPDEANQLTLIVLGDSGYFFLNESFISMLDLSERPDAGSIAIGTGFYTVDEQAGATTVYENFGIWPLEPAFGPDNGELVHALDDLIKLEETGVEERNLLVSATFLNPFDAAENDWDIGFSFRDDNDGTKYWLVIASEGEWELVGRYGDADSDTTLQDGDLDNLNTGAGESNEIILIVWGEVGFFFLNGEFIDSLDLFDITDAGDVEILTAFYFDHEIEGEATGYEDFAVWPLP